MLDVVQIIGSKSQMLLFKLVEDYRLQEGKSYDLVILLTSVPPPESKLRQLSRMIKEYEVFSKRRNLLHAILPAYSVAVPR
jgi:hypothetical protein